MRVWLWPLRCEWINNQEIIRNAHANRPGCAISRDPRGWIIHHVFEKNLGSITMRADTTPNSNNVFSTRQHKYTICSSKVNDIIEAVNPGTYITVIATIIYVDSYGQGLRLIQVKWQRQRKAYSNANVLSARAVETNVGFQPIETRHKAKRIR